ncbi:MAG: precorrin-6y C5,15-methyltransferase (decarboxylating) subunit CbiE [Planctomycetales bacterium]|nr:precorrin-6y C5,15-methyltransferase (decarboxylating) subunit CbiE [Planctomycetales bacterium]
MEKIFIIGIGDDGLEGLTSAARNRIADAELIVGPDSVLRNIDSTAQKLSVGSDLDALIQQMESQGNRRTVLLASGDPLFYGVARFLCDRLGKDRFEVLPHVSSMQLAFARVKESWDDAYLANLAMQSIDRVVERVRLAQKVGLFTTDECTPARVVRFLLDRNIDYFWAYVCENLGSPDERVTRGELAELADQTFSPLNVMILVRKPDVPDRPAEHVGTRLFGNADDLFKQSMPKRGLITPMEVRVIALAELDLGVRSTVWDVGAGSGAVAIEAARLAHDGMVYAIEMDADDHQLLISNSQAFQVEANLVPVLGKAPEAWADLPAPDAIFVGGTGRAVSKIVELAYERLKPGGRLVANVGSVNNLSAVHETALRLEADIMVRMISISQSTDQLDQLRFEALNPQFLITIRKAD